MNNLAVGGVALGQITRKKSLLLVASDPSIADVIGQMVGGDWELTIVDSQAEAWQRLGDSDVCLLDSWVSSAITLVIRALEDSVSTPIIWLGVDDELTCAAVMNMGASACISVDVLDKGGLATALEAALARGSDRFVDDRHDEAAGPLAIVSGMQDPVLICGTDGSILYANPAAGDVLGRSCEDLVGDRYAGLTDATDEYCRAICDIGGGLQSIDGHWSSIQWEGQAARLLLLRGATCREAIYSRMQRAYRALDSASMGVLIVDILLPEKQLVYVNRAFEKLTGYAEAELLGRSVTVLLHEQVDVEAVERIRLAMLNGDSCNVLVRGLQKDGQESWNEISLSPICDDQNNISHYLVLTTDVTERIENKARLEWLASHHARCGLLNQYGVREYLGSLRNSAARGVEPAHAFRVNLNGFHEINDRFGHDIGDRVLLEVGERLRLCMTDLRGEVGRIGSDEFILLVVGFESSHEADLFANAVRDAVCRPIPCGDLSLRVTCCIGICRDDPSSSDSMLVVRYADMAMHHAKAVSGKDVIWYEEQMMDRVGEMLVISDELVTAIANQQFVIYYQPQIDAATGLVGGIEAFVRWHHPLHGLLSPEKFLPAAEMTGQICAIGAMVVKIVCADAARLHAEGFQDVPLAINISFIELESDDLVMGMASSMDAAGISGGKLEIELSEAFTTSPGELASQRVCALHRLGIGIVVDNFGRGLSNLWHLGTLPVGKIKVDRSFIKNIISDEKSAAIVRGIISMAGHLRMKVVADGVETEAQSAMLRRMGFNFLQGYLIAEPMPFDDLVKWLRGNRVGPPVARVSSGGRAPPALLLVDDEINIQRALGRLLRRDGYKIFTASSAREGFAILAENEVHVIISDQRMPEMCGTEFLSKVKDLYPDTIRIVLSGYTDLQSVTNAINQGSIYRFLTKPWDDDSLRKHVRDAFGDLLQESSWERPE